MCEAFLLSFKTVLRFHHLPPPSDHILYFHTIFSIITQSCDIIARGGVVQFSHECDHRFYGQRQHSTTWKTSTGIKVAKNNDYSQTKCFSCGQCANKGIATNGKKDEHAHRVRLNLGSDLLLQRWREIVRDNIFYTKVTIEMNGGNV